METENLSTLKINVLQSQEQFNTALENEKVNRDELYLVPDEEIDLSDYATKEDIENKVNKVGDMMTGDLVIEKSYPSIRVKSTDEEVTGDFQVIENKEVALFNRDTEWRDHSRISLFPPNKPAAERLQLNGVLDGEWFNYNILHTGNKSLITSEDIGAVKKSGDTMTGNLTIQTNGWPSVYLKSDNGYTALYKNASSTNNNGTQLVDTNTNNSLQSRIVLNTLANLNNKIQLVTRETVDGKSTDISYSILHTGNKALIAPADIGAVKKSGDTMTGRLTLPSIVLTDHNAALEMGKYIDMRYSGSTADYDVRLAADASQLKINIEGTGYHTVLHTGNVSELNVARVTTGTYTGTGLYGANNPNSLTFDFIPKIIIITITNVNAAGNFQSSAIEYIDWHLSSSLIWSQGLTQSQLTEFRNEGPDIYRYYNLTNKTLSWYTDGGNSNFSNSASYQFNTNGRTYYYTVIG